MIHNPRFWEKSSNYNQKSKDQSIAPYRDTQSSFRGWLLKALPTWDGGFGIPYLDREDAIDDFSIETDKSSPKIKAWSIAQYEKEDKRRGVFESLRDRLSEVFPMGDGGLVPSIWL